MTVGKSSYRRWVAVVATAFERTGYKAGWVDPVNGRLLVMGGKGILSTDAPLEG